MYTLLITFFLVSIIFSFLCSLWESVLLSITPSYAEIKHREGTSIGRHLKNFKTNIDRPLAAILTLNTIAHTVGAIGVGMEAGKIWSEANPLVTSLAIPAIMTLAILFLSEIIPKTIGATYWKQLAPFTVNCLLFIVASLAPLVWVSQFITRMLKSDTKGSIFSRSDFLAMAELGADEGVFEQSESEIIANLIRFNQVKAMDIMTPRTVILAARDTMTIREFFDAHENLRFSRIPLYHSDTKDDIGGYILKDELLSRLVEDRGDETVGTLRREVMIIPRDFPLPDLFSRFIERREHIAIVVDEFGGMSGMVTMEDVIETLLGLEIIDESDHADDMQVLARKNWETRARSRGLISEEPSQKPGNEEAPAVTTSESVAEDSSTESEPKKDPQ